MKTDAAPVVNRSKNSGIAVVDDVLDMREDNIQIQNEDKSTNNDLFLARIRKLYQQDYRTRSESFEKIANYEIQGSRNLKEPSYFSELKFCKQKVRTRVIVVLRILSIPVTSVDPEEPFFIFKFIVPSRGSSINQRVHLPSTSLRLEK